MTTLAIQIPDDLKSFVDHSVESGGYKDASEFLTPLLYNFKARSEAPLTAEENAKLLALRSEIQIGIDAAERGDLVEFTLDDIAREFTAEAANPAHA